MAHGVGVLGLGMLGGAIARNLVVAGWPVVGYDPSPVASARLIANGGKALGSVEEVACRASILLTALASVDDFQEVIARIANAPRTGTVLIDVSTLPIEIKEQARSMLAQVGTTVLDCPISGTSAQAESKDVVVYASGSQDAYFIAKPVLGGFARRDVYLGDFGNGSKLKFISSLLEAIHSAAAAEAFTLAEKAGIDLQTAYHALYDGPGWSRVLQVSGALMVAGDYSEPNARVITFLRDLEIVSGFAGLVRCPTPLFEVAQSLYHSANSTGFANADTACVCQVLEQMAGVHREINQTS